MDSLGPKEPYIIGHYGDTEPPEKGRGTFGDHTGTSPDLPVVDILDIVPSLGRNFGSHLIHAFLGPFKSTVKPA